MLYTLWFGFILFNAHSIALCFGKVYMISKGISGHNCNGVNL